MMTIDQVKERALDLTLRFYASQPLAISRSTLRVQVENFIWQSAAYRIDVCCDEWPVFSPYPSDFARAHRIWMSATGDKVKAETIYTTPNLRAGEKPPPNRSGLYPGHATFAASLEAIGKVVAKGGRLHVEGLQVELSSGTSALARLKAGVTENEHGLFALCFDAKELDESAGRPPPFCFVRMIVDVGRERISDLRLERYRPPCKV